MLPMAKKKKNHPDLLLMYYREITGSEHLHFGYWNKGDALTMENLVKAQKRYLDHFFSYIPKGVKSILDVGAGVGGNANFLRGKGYEIVSVSPDPLLKIEFEKNTNHKIPYILSKYEELSIDQQFDMVLMSESCQYIDPSQGLKQSRKYLKDNNGYLLIIDYFIDEAIGGGDLAMAGHHLSHFKELASAEGFELVASDDITAAVAPSFDYLHQLYNQFLIPSFKVVARAIDQYLPFFYKLLRKFLGKQYREMIKSNNFDGATFAKYRKYMLFLFKKV